MALARIEAYSGKIEDERKRRAADTIQKILDEHRMKATELAETLGVHAQPGRPSQVTRWLRGHDLVGSDYQALLDMIADGRLALKHTGKRGRRNLFELACPEELAA
jgi:transcriptional regulator with XRE-family HTH domain